LNGSLTLREHPSDIVRLTCKKCGQAGRYRKQNLIGGFSVCIAMSAFGP
jgi:RNase P subunit RPR2